MASDAVCASSVAGLKYLPPFPPVACKVMNLLGRENVSFRDVADTLKTDPGLSAEVLRLANSALAGPRYPVKSILEALAVTGTQRVAALLMTLSLSRILKRAGGSLAIRRSWRHSLACALAAREFAEQFGCDADDAYLAGIFHDVGRLALLTLNPQLYDCLLAQPGELRSLEQQHFGIDHCEAGAILIRQWKLPAFLASAASRHHNPGQDADKLTRAVHAACGIARELGFSVSPAAVPNLAVKLGLTIAGTINSLECEYGL